MHQRFAIWGEIGVLVDGARARRTAVKATLEADRITKSFPDGGLSRDDVTKSIIDVAGTADVVVEFSTAA